MAFGTCEATSAVRKFGWFIPRPDGRVDLGVRSGAPLSTEILAEFEQVVGVMAELRPFVIDFLALENDFTVLARVEGDIATYLQSMQTPLVLGEFNRPSFWQRRRACFRISWRVPAPYAIAPRPG